MGLNLSPDDSLQDVYTSFSDTYFIDSTWVTSQVDSIEKAAFTYQDLGVLLAVWQWRIDQSIQEGDFAEAYLAQDSLIFWRDSLRRSQLNQLEQSPVNLIIQQSEIDFLRLENEADDLKIKRRQLVIYTLVTAMILLVLLLGLLVFRNRTTRHTYNLLEKRNREFQERNHELLMQRERLESSEEALRSLNASKDEFFSMVAKDLRFPLTSLSAYLSVMLKETSRLTKDELNTLAVKVDGSVRHLWHLIDNLLHWSRQQMRAIEVNPAAFSIERLIRDVVSNLHSIADEKQVVFHVDVPTQLSGKEVFADKGHVEFVVRNLVSNAIKFSPKQGEVSIEMSALDKSIQVSVKDSGKGIAREWIDEIWSGINKEKSESTNRDKGTGLGLMLCKDYVELNGGEIWVKSKPNRGAVFSFTLPGV
ncbi:MAG TPA: hypothetical protein DCE41_06855 [Cytophagales bacterium]|nr:hypothetical protein [Cytophagales bacterium]HAA19936.1 hypothetical protein [Cytophagales bacterium]HAP62636.1 hypothetical protein [Cytophagales bacterium]